MPVVASLDGGVARLRRLSTHMRCKSTPLIGVVFQILIQWLTTGEAEAADCLFLVRGVLDADVSQFERGTRQVVEHHFHAIGHEWVKLPDDRVVAMFDFSRCSLGKEVGTHGGNADQMLKTIGRDTNFGRQLFIGDRSIQRNMSRDLKLTKSLDYSCFGALISSSVKERH